MNAIDNRAAVPETRTPAVPPGFCMKLGIVTALAVCTGCAAGQVSDAPGNAATAPASPANGATVSIQGIAQSSDGSPIAGVEVCLRPDPFTPDHSTCTTSDSAGAWKLAGAPSNSQVAITFVKPGLFPTLRPIATGADDLKIPGGDGALVATGSVAALVGATVNPAAGHVAFSSATPGTRPVAGVTAILDSLDGAELPQTRPVYFDGGFFGNLPRGSYILTLEGASVSCTSSGGLYGFPVTLYTPDGQARVMFPVVEGFLTAPIAASCTQVGSGS